MWNKPWKYSEGFIIGAGLLVTGAALHLALGPIDWTVFAWPVNLIVLAVYIVVLIILYLLREKIYLVEWMMHFKAAVPAIVFCVVMTFIMGLTSWDMLSFWPFVLSYVWMTSIIGLACINHVAHFKTSRDIPFLLNHFGLFLALVAGTLGNPDIEKYKMSVSTDQPECRGIDKNGNLTDLPLAIELHQFHLDQYPPNLMLLDNASGRAIPEKQPESMVVEEGVVEGGLCGWNIRILQNIPHAAMMDPSGDPENFVPYGYMGSCSAVQVEAEKNGKTVKGWVSCGSFMFPVKALDLDDGTSIVMPQPEPKRFASDVEVYTPAGSDKVGTIEVNKPLKIDGYKIYQLSYDTDKGEWSETSVFQIVKDPWLPLVYTGIFMLLAGAVFNFLTAARKKE